MLPWLTRKVFGFGTVKSVRILTEVWFTISPTYQRENFNEILIIKANIMVNIFIVENWSQIVHYRESFDVL